MNNQLFRIVLGTALTAGAWLSAAGQSPTFDNIAIHKDGVITNVNINNPATITMKEGETLSIEIAAKGVGINKAFITATGVQSSWMYFISPAGAGSATLVLLPGDDAHTSSVDGHYTIVLETFDTIPGHTPTTVSLPVYVEDRNALTPNDTEMTILNYPNPVTAATQFVTTIEYIVPEGKGGHGTLKIYALTGHEIQSVVETQITPGHYFRQVDISALPAGTYVYRLAIDGAGSKSGRLVKL